MFELHGQYNKVKAFVDSFDQSCVLQIIDMINHPVSQNSKIRVMPDAHAGIGCVIGLTMTIQDRVCPNMVGVDIGCGMEVVELKEQDVDFEHLDHVIRTYIPTGAEKRDYCDHRAELANLDQLTCPDVAKDMSGYYIGTLGGGNHFIEIDKGDDGKLYLIIHSGSRKVGMRVADYYQKMAVRQMAHVDNESMHAKIQEWKNQGFAKEIQDLIQKEYKKTRSVAQPDMAYVTGYLLDDYMHDMQIVQDFADKNRQAIACDILKYMGLHQTGRFSTIHNYIDVQSRIMRKGAVSAMKYEKILIPLNMRDGSLICRGLGNRDWNCSAPHGAGRRMSRADAKSLLTMEKYREAMKGIYSTSVAPDTLDESPMAYKSMNTIIENIKPTAEILQHIKPVYNFKAGRRNYRKDMF